MISTKTKSDFTVRLANENDTLSIKKIWRECFTNDNTYIENFINNCFPHSKTWVVIPQISPDAVALLSLLPSYFISDGRKYSGGYIYGVATLPDFRGKSLSKLLMSTAFESAKETNLQYLVVKPANDGLFDLYRGQSFDILINKDLFSVNLLLDDYENFYFPVPNINHQMISGERFKKFKYDLERLFVIREREKSGTYLLWPSEILRFALLDIKNKGGDLHFISTIGLDREIYYIEHPDEEDSDIIKVVDSNCKDKREIWAIISHIKTTHKKAKRVIFEGNFHNISPLPFPITKTKSALIKAFDESIDSDYFSNIHLSLPME